MLTQCHLDLFDTCKIVEPILLNVCEVWGFSNNAIIEREFPLKKSKHLHLKQITPDFMVYVELGRYSFTKNKFNNVII